jgi:hypothetical protein
MSDMDNGTIAYLTERLLELELALENQDWTRMTWESGQEFSREGLRRIAELSRLMYLKNPLIRRGVRVQADYVFAQGVTIRCIDPAVNEFLQEFIDDERNQVGLFGHEALLSKERSLQLHGNLFLTLFTNKVTGRVVVRTIPAAQIDEIISDPQDQQTPWYYKRSWNEKQFDIGSGLSTPVPRQAYYPDWRYMPTAKPRSIGGQPVMWDAPIYHVAVGGLDDMQFGVSEAYPGLDWAKAYKSFLEDWATITRAYSRFAFSLTTKGGTRGVAAAKSTLATTFGNGGVGIETNPPPVTGATFISSDGVKLDPIRTSGATTKMEDGRRLLLMVAASQGLPETFYGDVSVGTLATAESLDRPTELSFSSRQQLWKTILKAVCRYALSVMVRAPRSGLQGVVTVKDDGTPEVMVRDADGQMVTPDIIVEFPPLVEHSTVDMIDAIIKASSKLPDQRLIASLLLSALGVADIDEVLERMFPADGTVTNQPEADDEPQTDQSPGQPPTGETDDTEETGDDEGLTEAVRELRRAVQLVVERGS